MGNKYHAKKVFCHGEWHDSQKEARRHAELLLLQRKGLISDLQYHKEKLQLIPAQKGPDGKVLFRAVNYIPDFTYIENGEKVYEDVKGMRTKEFILKEKLVYRLYGILIRET